MFEGRKPSVSLLLVGSSSHGDNAQYGNADIPEAI